MNERSICKICKEGYLLEHKTTTRSLLASQSWDFLDCSNLNCKLHKDFLEMYNNITDRGKEK